MDYFDGQNYPHSSHHMSCVYGFLKDMHKVTYQSLVTGTHLRALSFWRMLLNNFSIAAQRPHESIDEYSMPEGLMELSKKLQM